MLTFYIQEKEREAPNLKWSLKLKYRITCNYQK